MVAGVVLMDTATWFTFGGIGILIVVIAVDVFHGGDAATGYLNAALGVGGTIGAVLSGALVLRPKLGPVLVAGGTVLGVATIALGLSNLIGIAFVAIAVASAGNLILDVSRTTILQRAVPDAFRGRVNGLLYTTQSVSESAGTLVIPILVSVFGFGIVMGVAGVAVIVATAGAVLLIAGAGNVAPGRYDAELRRIARLPLFGGLSPARVEGALLGLTARTVAAGEVVIRQGEPADRFFIIESGAFEVTQAAAEGDDEVRRLRDAGTGRGVRRTRDPCQDGPVRDGDGDDRRPRVRDGRRRVPAPGRGARRGRRPADGAVRHAGGRGGGPELIYTRGVGPSTTRSPVPKEYVRLTTPLVRDGDRLTGVLRPATWDEALDRAAAGLRAAGEAHGSGTFGVFSCSKSTNEVNFAAQKFARAVLGSNNIDSCNRT